jgi:hypothetical protein
MSNTEINSLLEIAKNLESKGLYTQADKAREIMIRLSQGGMYFQSGYGSKVKPTLPSKMPKITPGITEDEKSRTYFGVVKAPKLNMKANTGNAVLDSFIAQINKLDPIFTALGIGGFLAFVGKNARLAAAAATPFAILDLKNRLQELETLIPRFNLKGFMSGEDTAAIEIVSEILGILADICDGLGVFVPAFIPWGLIFYGLSSTVNPDNVINVGYWAGGMPGGAEQMQDIENFNINATVDDPYIAKIIESMFVDLGIDRNNNNKILNASKLPRLIGGLDFFIPYVNKYDTEKKFKDLMSSQPSVNTMELKSLFPGIIRHIKKLQAINKSTTQRKVK